eukprot:5865509-Prymnesium_polylepis.1
MIETIETPTTSPPEPPPSPPPPSPPTSQPFSSTPLVHHTRRQRNLVCRPHHRPRSLAATRVHAPVPPRHTPEPSPSVYPSACTLRCAYGDA